MDSTTPASAPAHVTSVPGICAIAIKGCLSNSFFEARVELSPAEEAVLRESVAP
jgi:hypothetical protein